MNLENTYWSHKGKFKKELNELEKHIPSSGVTESLKYELIRALSKLYYDRYNNGGCNRDVLANYGQFFYDHMKSVNKINKESLLQFCSLDNSVSVKEVEKILDKTISICAKKTSKFFDLNKSIDHDHLSSSEYQSGAVWDRVEAIEQENEDKYKIDCYNCGSLVDEHDTWYDEERESDVCCECN